MRRVRESCSALGNTFGAGSDGRQWGDSERCVTVPVGLYAFGLSHLLAVSSNHQRDASE
jgi:hypothetical protein